MWRVLGSAREIACSEALLPSPIDWRLCYCIYPSSTVRLRPRSAARRYEANCKNDIYLQSPLIYLIKYIHSNYPTSTDLFNLRLHIYQVGFCSTSVFSSSFSLLCGSMKHSSVRDSSVERLTSPIHPNRQLEAAHPRAEHSSARALLPLPRLNLHLTTLLTETRSGDDGRIVP